MTKITIPKVSVPIGRVTIGGQAFDVMQHPEFVRLIFDLVKRVGGTEATGLDELSSLADAGRLGVFQRREAPQEMPDLGYIGAFGRRPEQAPAQLSIPNIAAFMPRPQEQSTPLADAGAVVCSRIFRAR